MSSINISVNKASCKTQLGSLNQSFYVRTEALLDNAQLCFPITFIHVVALIPQCCFWHSWCRTTPGFKPILCSTQTEGCTGTLQRDSKGSAQPNTALRATLFYWQALCTHFNCCHSHPISESKIQILLPLEVWSNEKHPERKLSFAIIKNRFFLFTLLLSSCWNFL